MAAYPSPMLPVVRVPSIGSTVFRLRPAKVASKDDIITEQLPGVNPQLASVLSQMQDALGLVKKLEQTLQSS